MFYVYSLQQEEIVNVHNLLFSFSCECKITVKINTKDICKSRYLVLLIM